MRKSLVPGFDSQLLHVTNYLIGKNAIVARGINKGKAGKIVQQEGDRVVIILPDNDRQYYHIKELIIE